MATNVNALLAAGEDYLALAERLHRAELRAELWKSVALKMRETTSIVGVRALRQAVEDEKEVL